MFNQYLELTSENADISMANVVSENLKFIVISLDQIFRGHAGEDYYDEECTFLPVPISGRWIPKIEAI